MMYQELSPLERELMAQGISPVFEPPVLHDRPEVKIDLGDLRGFLNS